MTEEVKKKTFSFKKFAVIFFGLPILLFIVVIISYSSADSKFEAPLPTPDMTATIQNISDRFCEARKGEYSYGVFICSGCINLEDANKLLTTNEVITLHNADSPPKSDVCNKIAQNCIDSWDTETCQNIADRKIWIGMTKTQLYLTWGVPKDKNNTVTKYGINTQWVYADFGPYVYLEGKDEDSLKVTSWQD